MPAHALESYRAEFESRLLHTLDRLSGWASVSDLYIKII